MSDTVNRVKILDDVVAVNSTINYSALIGGQHITSQPFKAISASPSSMIFNIVAPSVETILDRRIMMKATCILRIDIQNRLPNTQPVNYGITDALAPFPLNQLIQNIQCSINNNNITLQQSDVLDVILRSLDSQALAEYDPFCPTGLDYLYDYADGIMVNPWYLDLKPTGTPNTYQLATDSGPVTILGLEAADNKNDSTFTSFQNNILAADYNRVQNTSHYHKPRGSFVIDAIFVAPNDAAAVQGTKNPLASYAAGTNSIYVEFTTTEPLFLSPFLQGISSCEDHSGIFGVNALNFTINFMGGTGASRAWHKQQP